MIQGLAVIAASLASVNFPLFMIGSTKRLSFILLLIASVLSLFHQRGKLHKESLPALLFWILMILSSLVGAISNQIFNSFFISVFFTCAVLFAFLCIVDFQGKCIEYLAISVLFLNGVGLVYILSVVQFDFTKMFFLRRYLLESGVSINSIFNQFYCLIFYNLLLAVAGVRYRVIFLAFSVVFLGLTLFSLSRQNFLAMMLMLLIFLLLSRNGRIWLMAVGLLFSVLIIPVVEELEQFSYVISRIEKTQSQVASGEYSRFQQYYDSIVVGLENPFFGLGIGGFYEFAELKGYSEHTRVPEAALNQLSAEHGVFMLLVYLSVFYWMVLRFWYKAGEEKAVRNLSIAFMFGYVFLCLFNEVHVTPMFWMSYFIAHMVVYQRRVSRGVPSY